MRTRQRPTHTDVFWVGQMAAWRWSGGVPTEGWSCRLSPTVEPSRWVVMARTASPQQVEKRPWRVPTVQTGRPGHGVATAHMTCPLHEGRVPHHGSRKRFVPPWREPSCRVASARTASPQQAEWEWQWTGGAPVGTLGRRVVVARSAPSQQTENDINPLEDSTNSHLQKAKMYPCRCRNDRAENRAS